MHSLSSKSHANSQSSAAFKFVIFFFKSVFWQITWTFATQSSVLNYIVTASQNSTSYHSTWNKSDANSLTSDVFLFPRRFDFFSKEHVSRQMHLMFWGSTLGCRLWSNKYQKIHLIVIKRTNLDLISPSNHSFITTTTLITHGTKSGIGWKKQFSYSVRGALNCGIPCRRKMRKNFLIKNWPTNWEIEPYVWWGVRCDMYDNTNKKMLNLFGTKYNHTSIIFTIQYPILCV